MRSQINNISLLDFFVNRGINSQSFFIKAVGSSSRDNKKNKTIFIYCLQGQILGVYDEIKLLDKLQTDGHLSARIVSLLQDYSQNQPIGKVLQNTYCLKQTYLEDIFQFQLNLFNHILNWDVGYLDYEQDKELTNLPVDHSQLTGLSVPILTALRSALNSNFPNLYLPQLPDIRLGITVINSQVDVKISSLDLKILKFADTNNSLQDIAQKINTDIFSVQKSIFYLSLIGVVRV